ncbi:glycosyltransferase, partial [bacterium]|nr:glycosyltransferase [bacterium]
MREYSKAPCSIVITNFNGKDLLDECLTSVVQAVSRHNPLDEIIVVDDSSQDESCDFISSHFPSVRLVANPVNVGFQRASNIGAFVAKFPIVVFLNNDVIVDADSISILCGYFDRYANLFAASAKLYGWDRESFLAGRRIAT